MIQLHQKEKKGRLLKLKFQGRKMPNQSNDRETLPSMLALVATGFLLGQGAFEYVTGEYLRRNPIRMEAPAQPGQNNQPSEKDKPNQRDTQREDDRLRYIPKDLLDRLSSGYRM